MDHFPTNWGRPVSFCRQFPYFRILMVLSRETTLLTFMEHTPLHNDLIMDPRPHFQVVFSTHSMSLVCIVNISLD